MTRPVTSLDRPTLTTIHGYMSKSRYRPPTDIPAETRQFAERMAERIGARPEEIRYAQYRYHNGRHWTVRACWERLVDGQWTEVDSKHYPTFDTGELHPR